MKLLPMKDILGMAEERGITYGAYVTVSYETALAAAEADTELDISVVFVTGTGCCDLMNSSEGTVDTVKGAMKVTDYKVPVAFHPDHCRTYEECVQAIQTGYSSVMVDGSSLPFEENMVLAKKVANYVHCYGIMMEGELGKLAGEEGNSKVKDDPESVQIDPDQAKESMERTGIGYIAINIGTQHGVYVATLHLNIERLKRIHDMVDVSTVSHGGSGIPKEQVQEATRNGIRKINVATDILIAVANSPGDVKQEPDFKYSTGMFISSQAYAGEFIKKKMRGFILVD